MEHLGSSENKYLERVRFYHLDEQVHMTHRLRTTIVEACVIPTVVLHSFCRPIVQTREKEACSVTGSTFWFVENEEMGCTDYDYGEPSTTSVGLPPLRRVSFVTWRSATVTSNVVPQKHMECIPQVWFASGFSLGCRA